MAPSKKPGNKKKEKVFHPQSRKADQLVRAQIRKSKLSDLAKARTQKQHEIVDIFAFFYHAIPPEGVLTLEDLHTIVRDIWLTRYDSELESERAARRKGRPKSVKEIKLEDLKLREAEVYRTGMEVIDLTHPVNVQLFRQWDQKEPAYIQQLRFIRISSENPERVIVSKPGKHPLLVGASKVPAPNRDAAKDENMDEDEAPLLLEPPSRFASTIATMDGTL